MLQGTDNFRWQCFPETQKPRFQAAQKPRSWRRPEPGTTGGAIGCEDRQDGPHLIWREATLRVLHAGSYAAGAMKASSRLMATLSLTRTPPASRTAFQVRPKSLRLMVVSAETPARVLPKGSTATPLNSVSRDTGRVTPLMVRSPWSS